MWAGEGIALAAMAGCGASQWGPLLINRCRGPTKRDSGPSWRHAGKDRLRTLTQIRQGPADWTGWGGLMSAFPRIRSGPTPIADVSREKAFLPLLTLSGHSRMTQTEHLAWRTICDALDPRR